MKVLLIFTVLFSSVLLAFSQDRPSTASIRSIHLPDIRSDLKPGEGRDKAESLCVICHSLDYIPMQPGFSKTQWAAIVNKMIKVLGAPINETDANLIIDYLSENYGSKK
jgi:hypothetical protein